MQRLTCEIVAVDIIIIIASFINRDWLQLDSSALKLPPLLFPKGHIRITFEPVYVSILLFLAGIAAAVLGLCHRLQLGLHPGSPQAGLLLLVCSRRLASHAHLPDKSEEQGASIPRQRRFHMIGQTPQRRFVRHGRVEADGSASRAAVVMRQLHAVDVGLAHRRVEPDGLADLGGGDVFGLPAESVADAVAEEGEAAGVAAQDVARPKPGIAGGQDVAQDLGVGGARVVEVALEALLDVLGREAVQHLAGLAGLNAAAQVRHGVAPGSVGVVVDLDDGRGAVGDERVQPARAADGAAAQVVATDVPRGAGRLGGGVELGDGLDTEAFLDAVPDVRAQAVAKGEAHAVLAVEVLAGDGVHLRRRGEQVAQRLADVLDCGGL